MKKIILVLIILLAGCGNKNNDIKLFKEEFESLNNNNVAVSIDDKYNVEYLSISGAVSFLENDTGILLLGISTDGMTRSIIETLLEVAYQNDLKLVYYSPSSLIEDDTETLASMLGILDEYLQLNEDGVKMLAVPDVYFIKEGKIIGHHYGTLEDKINLSSEEKEELYNIYNDYAFKVGE